jgi:hypothetical protein
MGGQQYVAWVSTGKLAGWNTGYEAISTHDRADAANNG